MTDIISVAALVLFPIFLLFLGFRMSGRGPILCGAGAAVMALYGASQLFLGGATTIDVLNGTTISVFPFAMIFSILSIYSVYFTAKASR